MAGKQAEAAEAPLRVKVRPIDRAAKGSRGERRAVLELIKRVRKIETADLDEQLAVMDERDRIMREHLELADGGDLLAALDALSEAEYDELFQAILGGAAESSVPTTSGEPSNGSPKDFP